MQCLILAGGLGTRMRAHNPALPKTLLPVAGRPFADWQLQWLAAEGVDSVIYSIGHRAELIRQFVEDGRRWGLTVTYVEESDELLGTGGAIRLACDQGVLDQHFFVLYGDSYLQVDLHAVDRAFQESGLPALMTVYENNGEWVPSNVVFDGSAVIEYRKGVENPPPSMRYIDYGLSILSQTTVTEHIPRRQHYDLADLMTELSSQQLLAGFLAWERFYEIGSPLGLEQLDEFLTDRSE